MRILIDLFCAPRFSRLFAVLIFLAELVFNYGLVRYRKYTEIDWKAYMQEVEGYLNGSTNYMELKGDTGPLVYPGGFVYLYSFLYKITDNGADIFKAQQIFAGFYMLQLLVVLIVYCQLAEKARFPPWMMIFASISGYRVHSIFSLRMFNDGPANILAWIAVYCFMNKKWTFGSIIYSLAISIKMNNLLFLPGICVVFMRNLKIPNTIFQFLVILLVQGAVGYEFLSTYPREYIAKAFEFNRKFFHKWTVNFRFLDEEIFLDDSFQKALLGLHLIFLVLFCSKRWMPKRFGTSLVLFPVAVFNTIKNHGSEPTCPLLTADILFTSNLIGIVFARSLHYQFYVWYYHSLPLLVHMAGFNALLSVVMFFSFEYCWFVFPSTNFSSALLVFIHLLLLFKLFCAKWPATGQKKSKIQ